VLAVDPGLVEAQVRAVVEDFASRRFKTGMLARPATVERVAELAREGLLPHLVVDPVLVSSTGHALMDAGGARRTANRCSPTPRSRHPTCARPAS